MFVGNCVSKLDSKCRVIFPSQLKRQVPEEDQAAAFVLKRDVYAKCLVLYTMSEWNSLVDFVRSKVNPFNRRHAELLREFYRGTAEVYLDNNSRFLIPKSLLDYIGGEKELMFAGLGDKIEIWSKDIYDKMALGDDDVSELAESILGDGNSQTEAGK